MMYKASHGWAAFLLSGFVQGSPAQTPVAVVDCKALGLSVCPTPMDAALPAPTDMLTWDQPDRVVGFRNTFRMYAGDVFHAGAGPAHPLPPAPRGLTHVRYSIGNRTLDLEDYIRRQSVAGLLILKGGRVAFEYYGAGNTATTLWTSRSVAKSVVSILIGVAIQEGFIKSVDDPVTQYLPDLNGTAWEHVTLRQLLQHTSGVSWNEHYADADSDFSHLTHCEAGPAPYPCVLNLVKSVKRDADVAPGDRWSYDTGGAWLVGRVLEKATGMTIARYLETRIWSRFAMQSDGVWEALVPGSVDMGGHGFNATLRDWGRFAEFVASGGLLAGRQRILPAGWIAQSTSWTRASGSVTADTPDGQYGYQWWYAGIGPRQPHAKEVLKTARRSFWAEGIYGQAIAIDPKDHLEMVQWSTWREADGPPAMYDEQAIFFDAVARTLK